MLALDSAKSGNQKGQVLRAVTFNSPGKGTPKVTLLQGLSSFAAFSYSMVFWSFTQQHVLVFLFWCGNTRLLTGLCMCPVLRAFHMVPLDRGLLTDSRIVPRGRERCREDAHPVLWSRLLCAFCKQSLFIRDTSGPMCIFILLASLETLKKKLNTATVCFQYFN